MRDVLFDVERPENGPSRVYVIGAEGSSVVKIGHAGDVPKRLREIQVGNPVALSTLWVTPGSRPLESKLHVRFARFRLQGEWFDFGCLNPVDEISRYVSELGYGSQGAARAVVADQLPTDPISEFQSLPVGQRIAAELRAEVMSGIPAFGRAIGSTSTLMARFSASSQTVQRAIDTLRSEGIVTSRPAQGVYASYQPRPVYMHGGISGLTIVGVQEELPPGDVQEALGIAVGEKVVVRHVTRSVAGVPIELASHHYPRALAINTDLVANALIRGDADRILAEAERAVVEVRHRLVARLPTALEIEKLHLSGPVPIVRVLEVATDAKRIPVRVSTFLQEGHRVDFEFAAYGGAPRSFRGCHVY